MYFYLPYYEQRANNVFNSLEFPYNDVFVGSKDQLVEKQDVISYFVVNDFKEVFHVLVYENYGYNFVEYPIL